MRWGFVQKKIEVEINENPRRQKKLGASESRKSAGKGRIQDFGRSWWRNSGRFGHVSTA